MSVNITTKSIECNAKQLNGFCSHISEFHTCFPSLLCRQAVFVTHAGFLECLQSVSHDQTLQEDYDIGLGYTEPWPTL